MPMVSIIDGLIQACVTYASWKLFLAGIPDNVILITRDTVLNSMIFQISIENNLKYFKINLY